MAYILKQMCPYTVETPDERRAIEAWLEEMARGGHNLQGKGLYRMTFRSSMPPKPLRYRMEHTGKNLPVNQARRLVLQAQGWQYAADLHGYNIYATEDLSKEALPPWPEGPVEKKNGSLRTYVLWEVLFLVLAYAVMLVLFLGPYINPKSTNSLLPNQALQKDLCYLGIFTAVMLLLIVFDIRKRLRAKRQPLVHTDAVAKKEKAKRIASIVLVFVVCISPSVFNLGKLPNPMPIDRPSGSTEILPLRSLNDIFPEQSTVTDSEYLEYPNGPNLRNRVELWEHSEELDYQAMRYQMRTPDLAQRLLDSLRTNRVIYEPVRYEYVHIPSLHDVQVWYYTERTDSRSYEAALSFSWQRILFAQGDTVLQIEYKGPEDLRQHLEHFATKASE